MFNSEEEYDKVMLDLANAIYRKKKEGAMDNLLEEGCVNRRAKGERVGDITQTQDELGNKEA